MIVGERVAERLAQIGMTQADLARRVGVSQPTINNLIRRSKKGSTHLHKVARELGTTPAYLSGETDNPDENAPPPVPASRVQMLMMPVALPSETVLAEMFEAMLLSLPKDLQLSDRLRDELSHELAMLLPTALGTAQGPLRHIRIDQGVPPSAQIGDGDDARPSRLRA